MFIDRITHVKALFKIISLCFLLAVLLINRPIVVFAENNVDSKDCVSIKPGKCAFHADGTPQTCLTSDGDNGLCVEKDNQCLCVSEPANCDEYQKLFSSKICYETDGSIITCPIGTTITLDYGSLVGQIYCCCNDGTVKEVLDDDPHTTDTVIESDTGTQALP